LNTDFVVITSGVVEIALAADPVACAGRMGRGDLLRSSVSR